MDRLSDYDYNLPEALIAQTPLAQRDQSKLLVLDRQSGSARHHTFADVTRLLRPGDCLILNNTQVSALRVLGRRPTGGQVELLLLREVEEGRFEALLKPAKRLKPGSIIEVSPSLRFVAEDPLDAIVCCVRVEGGPDWRQELASHGRVPLPPYITAHLPDPDRYQTVFASVPGSAAAPTAGLHFTAALLDALRNQGVGIGFVTLDVSIDTFRPVQAENLNDHVMHGESCTLSPETADMVNACQGRVIAVGTTCVRTLESFAVAKGRVEPGMKTSKLFIRPGFEFQVVQGMFTNFHMPKTTMLVMLSAFAGRDAVFGAYEEAIQNKYRFLSFGDSMLIF